ncbi:hypothetical protein N7481_002026 [Penicillium waksmanii]|uniref:uncharacterized protein n=1 Tax=Penicillium waksmanii TaxID=69791 RepID=UPI00254847D2|nr:uncharacterized protein N7481_002026 [Penicillium waksmanii]KAJ5995049.1 hypothetical protein N7481_002026 [Penicillium waksmanii]
MSIRPRARQHYSVPKHKGLSDCGMILVVLGHMANQIKYFGCGVRKRGLLVTWLGARAPSKR